MQVSITHCSYPVVLSVRGCWYVAHILVEGLAFFRAGSYVQPVRATVSLAIGWSYHGFNIEEKHTVQGFSPPLQSVMLDLAVHETVVHQVVAGALHITSGASIHLPSVHYSGSISVSCAVVPFEWLWIVLEHI